MSDSSANFYARMLQKRKWLAKKAKHLQYPDFSMKDASVPPRFSVPQCVCGLPTEIIQSTNPDTSARAYYTCEHHLPEMRCHFFQWIDGPTMYDRAFIQQKYMLNFSMRTETFERWKPYVPDPIEEAPEEPRTHPTDKGNAPATETGDRRSFSRRPRALHTEEPVSQNMEDFDTRHRRWESRDKGKGKGKAPATEPSLHSVSGRRSGALHIDDDMDDFDIRNRRGKSCDKGKGKGKAPSTETGRRRSVSGRPSALCIEDDMDDFDNRRHRGHPRDKGQWLAMAPQRLVADIIV